MLHQRLAQQHHLIRLQFVDGFLHALDERLCVVDSLLVGPPGAHAPDAPALPFKRLAGLPLVLASRPNGLRTALDEICRRVGVQLLVAVEADSMLTMKGLVMHGGLYSVLPCQLVHEELAAGRMSAAGIVRPTVPRVLTLALSNRQAGSAAVRAVAQAVRGIVRESLVKTVWR